MPIESPGLGNQLGVVNGGDGRFKRTLNRKTLQRHGGQLIVPDQSHTGQVEPEVIQSGILTGCGNIVELDTALFAESQCCRPLAGFTADRQVYPAFTHGPASDVPFGQAPFDLHVVGGELPFIGFQGT